MQFIASQTTGHIEANVRDSVAANNSTGIAVLAEGGGTVTLMVERSSVINNTDGIGTTHPGATVTISNSTIRGNTGNGMFASGSQIISYGTNRINGNAGNETPTSTIALK